MPDPKKRKKERKVPMELCPDLIDLISWPTNKLAHMYKHNALICYNNEREIEGSIGTRKPLSCEC